MIAGIHDLVEISHLAEIGGPAVVLFSAIGAVLSASGAASEDKVEKALFGGLIGAVAGFLFGSAIIAALV
jgi:hypothetical protein